MQGSQTFVSSNKVNLEKKKPTKLSTCENKEMYSNYNIVLGLKHTLHCKDSTISFIIPDFI